MPTIFEWKGWKFHFFSLDRPEPPHVHVRKDRKELKIWLSPLRLAYNRRCSAKEAGAILKVADQRKSELIDAWNHHFG